MYSALRVGKYQLAESCDATIPPSAAADGNDDDNDKDDVLIRRPIILYEFESCPCCRRVREAASMLSLEVEYRPCPKKSVRYRKAVKDRYGKSSTFPLMVDPNTGATIFRSSDIVTYLFKT